MRIFLLVILTVAAFIALNNCSNYPDLPVSQLNFVVVGEDQLPISDAKVTITFEQLGKDKYINKVGLTDMAGKFSATSKSTGHIGFGVEKNGYYETAGGGGPTRDRTTGKWQPWNPELKVVLRRIVNPVAMYARKLELDFPIVSQDIGFDLIEYAWMPPYGNGKHADFIFNIKRNKLGKDKYDGSLSIKFHNNDGIQAVKDDYSIMVVNQYQHHSKFILPRNAPETGYKSKLTLPYRSERDVADIPANYMFRVRSKIVNSKIVGMYGKIVGDIIFDFRGSNTATLNYKYYLNPDYTTNLEHDSRSNLFKNLKSFEYGGL